MSTPAHTPGPWTIFPRDPEIEGFTVETTPDQLPVAIVPKNRRPNSEAEANARLFAAAPDLLAVAKEAFQYSPFHTSDCEGVTEHEEGAIFDETNGCTCFLSRLRVAIAKAEGRS